MEKSTITLENYINKTQTFIIPYYQRGYVWGKKRENGDDSVHYITQTLLDGYEKSKENGKKEIFLQGVTVVEKNNSVYLIDGQQRTTYFSLLLTYLSSPRKINLKYEIREESGAFLQHIQNLSLEEIKLLSQENLKEEFQDIYYFKKTLRILNEKLESVDKKNFLNYIYDFVNFLYIQIPENKATRVFSMMNGNKAQMTQEELIKAELLRLASLSIASNDSEKWEQSLLRSKYAREWDRWTYWWNRSEVKSFYRVDGKNEKMLGLLLETYYQKNRKESRTAYSFESFRDICLRAEKNELAAKNTFYELRHLQKRFEDIFNSVGDGKNLHNKIGAILCLLNDNSQRRLFIDKYFNNFEVYQSNYIELYYKYVFLGLSHSDIEKYIFDEENEDIRNLVNETIKSMVESISDKDLYNKDNSYAFLQLLRLNIEEDNKLSRAFDFSFWAKNKSLEHIFPKSKVYYINSENEYKRGDGKILSKKDYETMKTDGTCLDRNKFPEGCSEHCIGNLVLLHKNENSSFGTLSFDKKKQKYFEFDESFESRHLLHTVSVFANSKWGIQEIENNKNKVINGIKDYYGYTD